MNRYNFKTVEAKWQKIWQEQKYFVTKIDKTKRKFLPNLKKVTFVSHILKKNIKLNVTNSALRSVDKKGSIDSFLKDVKFINLSPRVKKIKKLLIAKN